MPFITVAINLSHQHSHGKMSRILLLKTNYQANPELVELDPTISHCVPSSTFVYILCTYFANSDPRQTRMDQFSSSVKEAKEKGLNLYPSPW